MKILNQTTFSLSEVGFDLWKVTPCTKQNFDGRCKLCPIHQDPYEMNFILCWFIMTMVLCKHFAHNARLHRPIVIINQQYTKGEIHVIYLHYFYALGLCFEIAVFIVKFQRYAQLMEDPWKNCSDRQQPCHLNTKKISIFHGVL